MQILNKYGGIFHNKDYDKKMPREKSSIFKKLSLIFFFVTIKIKIYY